MIPELEKPRVTEIQVRMDCNGCVQKIKKALHGIKGIYDIYIDVPKQKLTVIGWADPEKIVKAIKKTRKVATICADTEPAPPNEPQSEGGAPPPPDPANPPPTEEVEPAEPPPDQPPPPPETEVTPPDEPPPPSTDSTTPQPHQPSGLKDGEQVHVVHHYPPQHGYRYNKDESSGHVYNGHVDYYPSVSSGSGLNHEPPQAMDVNHSYNTYKPTPYVTQYEYIRPPPPYNYHRRPEPTPPPPPSYPHHETPEPPQPQHTHHSTAEPPPAHYEHHSAPEPHPQLYTHSSKLEQPQPYKRFSKPQPAPQLYTNYNRSELPQQYTRYTRPEPPEHNTHYRRPEPPQHYTQYSRAEPPQQYTSYSRPEPPPHYMSYNSDYHSSNNGGGNITSIFSDENPNACRIV